LTQHSRLRLIWNHTIMVCAKIAPTRLPLLCQLVQNRRKR